MRVALAIVLLAACSTPATLPHVRFANAPPVTAVEDQRDVPKAPSPRTLIRWLYHWDGSFQRRLTRTLELPSPQRALGVNARDEVPDSTWFTNRIGAHPLSCEQVANGPTKVGSPELHKPWTVIGTKIGGASLGFTIKDARGEKFLLKFDEVGFPEIETAAAVIVNRLMWASGFNVPEDFVVYFTLDDLVVAPDAAIKDPFGNKRPLTRDDMLRRLQQIDIAPNGQIRGLTSRILDGTWLGGHGGEGVRPDDPNDRIPHELRRDLRGAASIYSWLDHSDLKEDNTLDMWVEDPADPKRHFVRHYMIDFGKALGAMATIASDPRRGFAYSIDFVEMFSALSTAGMLERSWESRVRPQVRGVGAYEVTSYDPGAWRPYTPVYFPFQVADVRDRYWGAKILMRFTRGHLRAAVEAGRLTDPSAVEYLIETLVARQRATARHWFERVSPLEQFRVAAVGGGHGLCFDDLLLTYELAPVTRFTTYRLTAFDRAERALAATSEVGALSSGHTCTGKLPLAPGDGYTIVKIDTHRRDQVTSMFVHLARDPADGAPRVIGIWRP